jgi:hypothetical protein
MPGRSEPRSAKHKETRVKAGDPNVISPTQRSGLSAPRGGEVGGPGFGDPPLLGPSTSPPRGAYRRHAVTGLAWLCAFALAAIVTAPRAAAEPPTGRAYELVSPVDDPSGSNAGLLSSLEPVPGMASDDGNRFLYGAAASMGEAWSGQTNAMIFGDRTPTGWKARTATVSIDHGDTPLQSIGTETTWGWLSSDGGSYSFVAGNFGAITSPTAAFMSGLYRANDDGTAPEWLSRPIDGIVPKLPEGSPNYVQQGLYANDDTSVLAFQSPTPLTGEAPSEGTSAVYASVAGRLELASKLPDGSVPTESSSLVCGSGPLTHPSLLLPYCSALAGNGRFVVFNVGSGSGQSLYVRDLQQGVTRQLAGPAMGLPEAILVAAPRGGARAYFKRGGVSGLYEADLEGGTPTLRPAITGEPIGLSPDGSHLLFLEAPPVGGEDWTLRYWDESNPGTSVEVGSLGPSATQQIGGGTVRARAYRSLDQGRTWIFTAAGSPDPARPNSSPTTQQLYRWTVGQGAPTCLSCEPVDGLARTTGVNVTVQQVVATEIMTDPTVPAYSKSTDFGFSSRKLAQPGHAISNDGRFILFDSPDRLVPEDTNDVRDVYLWDREGAPGQQLQLVTSGKGNTPSYALDIDPTGTNVFFSTREGLVPADKNANYNVYDARIGGGFPESGESCAGEGCRPAVVPPLPVSIGSNSLGGDGNLRPGSHQARAAVRVKKVKSARGRVAKLKVRVSGAGRISVSGPSVRAAKRSVAKAGTYRVTVKPNARAQKRLAKKKSLKVRARVSYKAKGGRSVSKTVTVTFKTKSTVRKGR